MTQAYSNPARADEPDALPDIEVFYAEEGDVQYELSEGFDPAPAGWYWWSCFPGCLPDGDPSGPFESYAEALADAQAYAQED